MANSFDWSDPGFYASALPLALSALGQIFQSGTANDRYNQATRAAAQVPPWQQFYQPMSQAAQDAMRRSIQADLATRGIPLDSSYATALTAERFGSIEAQLQQAAMQDAARRQQLYVQTLMGAPQGGGLAGLGQAAGGIGQYLALQRLRQALQQQSGGGASPGASPGPVATQGLFTQNPATDFYSEFMRLNGPSIPGQDMSWAYGNAPVPAQSLPNLAMPVTTGQGITGGDTTASFSPIDISDWASR